MPLYCGSELVVPSFKFRQVFQLVRIMLEEKADFPSLQVYHAIIDVPLGEDSTKLARL